MAKVLLATVWVATFTALAQGHGRLVEPPARGTAWRQGFYIPANYDDHETNCGGFQVLHGVFKGKCGVCGDPFGGERRHEPGPHNVFASGVIVRTYTQGQTVTADVEITASHKGFYQFRLCQNNVLQSGRNQSVAVEQGCFDRILLKSPDGKSRFDEGVRNIRLKLPDDVVCTACVLQWRWKAGNSWGCQSGACGLGLGDQEEFWACADVAIVSREGPRAPTVSSDRTRTVVNPSSTVVMNSNPTRSAATSRDRPRNGRLTCRGLAPWGSRHDSWCNTNCNHDPPHCPSSHCACSPTVLND